MISVWVKSDSTNQPVWNRAGLCPAVEHVQHHEERQVIEDRADRPDKQNEAWILPIVHLRGLVSHSASTSSVGIVVCEKSYSRLLVSTWIGSIGRKRQEDAGPQTLNMLPKFELARHLDVLDDVAEHAAALQHALLQNQQAVFQQDDVGRFLGDIDRAVDRDPTSAAFRAGASLMPSPMNPDHVSVALQRPDDAFLVRRDQPGKDVVVSSGLGQLRLAHRLDLGAEQEVLRRHAHFLADVGGDDLVVASQDLDVHAQAVEPLQAPPWRVSLGGSRKARKPSRIRSDSSLTA